MLQDVYFRSRIKYNEDDFGILNSLGPNIEPCSEKNHETRSKYQEN